MSRQVCRWGILSAANIARKNWTGIRHSGNAVIAAVASRDKGKAQQFIDECQAHTSFETKPVALGSYDELLKSPDIDAVYVPVPTGVRKDLVIKAAEAGKHVLAEKPVGCTVAEVKEMLAACKKNNVQFMDGVMFMHSQRLNAIREVLDDKKSIGDLRRIASAFSFCGNDEFANANIRSSGELEPLGALGDLGWYNIRFTLWVMKYEMPKKVTGRMLTEAKRSDSKTSVPTEFSGEMFFSNGISATYYCSFKTGMQQWANVSGTLGYLDVPDFVIGYYGNEMQFTVRNAALAQDVCTFNMEDHVRRVAVPEYGNGHPTSQETNLFRNFSNLVLSKKIDESWPEISLKTQQVMEACLNSARQDGKAIEL